MQVRVLVFFLLSLALTEAFIFGNKNKCPIKKYKSSKYITGDQLLIHESFESRVDAVEILARNCRVHVYVKGSYYQLKNPSDQALVAEADLVIGHGLKFELRDESNSLLCNKLCLSRYPMDMPEVKCFLQGLSSNGLTWRSLNPDLLSDNTYASDVSGWQTLKTDIQTKCQKENFKRQLLRALRQMDEQDEQDSEGNTNDGDDDKKK